MSKPDSWAIHLAAGGRFGLIKGGWFRNMDPEARGFAEKCGWGGVVDGFEKGAPGYGDE